jgi:hypothetical protein
MKAARKAPVLLVLLLLALDASATLAQGTGRVLDIPPGARQNGLGSAGVALLGDPSDALWWNPAALGFADETSAQMTHATLVPDFGGVPFFHAALAAPLGTFGGVGASFSRLNYDFSGFGRSQEMSPSFALGIRARPELSFGATLKWVQIDLGGTTGETFATDLGVLMHLDRDSYQFGLGLMYQNLGGNVTFINEDVSSPLSKNWKVGASMDVPVEIAPDVIIGALGVFDYNQSDVTSDFHLWSGGVEAYFADSDLLRFAVRGGYYDDKLGEIQDFTYGAGVRLWILSADGAWIPQAEGLDRVFKLTIGIHADLGVESD